MVLERFEVPGLAHYSYIVSSRERAVVVDPKRDVDTYLAFAAERGWKITYILETHIHADYASGARELASATGAELWLSAHDEGEDYVYQFPHNAMRDGDRLEWDGVAIAALHTPGHTPEHLSFLIHEPAQSPHPAVMLSGDFLFVGSLGRPDLLGEQSKRRLAELLYDSLHRRIGHLPDDLEVRPAHGAGSFCGSGMSDRPQSTLGYERASNIFFGEREREQFVSRILAHVPPFPDYYRRMKRVNAEGPRLLGQLPGDRAIEAAEFRDSIERENAVVVDCRSPESFGRGHVPGSLNIGAGGGFSTWAAWVVPYDRPLLLVGDRETNLDDARRGLARVGLDDARGFLEGGFEAWAERGWPQSQIEQVSAAELDSRRRSGAVVVDVRSDAEWSSGHIPGSLHIMGGDLPKRLGELPRDARVNVVCASGYRSGVAASVLRRAGFTGVANLSRGLNEWRDRGLPLETGD
jgi:hydroxyacylglutathione hydrolase